MISNFFSGKNYCFLVSRIIFLLLLLLVSVNAQAQSKPPFHKNTKRILFLGNSITYAGQYISDLESYFIIHFPEQQYEFVNLGLPSETVSGLSEPGHAGGKFPRPKLQERLERVLAQVKPDVVFACYGMNDGIYLPFDPERFQAFRAGINWLHAELVKSGAKRIIHLTPPVHDDKELGTKGYNLVLSKYSQWLLSQRDSLKWEVADVHSAMTHFLETKRLTQPDFKLAPDGVHPGELGHWLIAKTILLYLDQNVAKVNDVLSTFQGNSRAEEIYKLVTQRQGFMKDAWLKATGFKRPGMAPGLPLPEAKQKYKEIEKRIRVAVKG